MENDRIDIDEIEVSLNGYSSAFRLRIDNGFVRLSRIYSSWEEPRIFYGFIDKTEEGIDFTKGIIRFTNGVPYYYIKDGTAEIEIKNDGNIIIKMFYSPAPYMLERLYIQDWMQFPALLILEFQEGVDISEYWWADIFEYD